MPNPTVSLPQAVIDGNLEQVRLLLKRNPTKIKQDNKDEIRARKSNYTPEPTCLHLACRYGHLPIVKLLVQKGASLKSTSVDNKEMIGAEKRYARYAPLHCASMYGFAKIVSFLVERGANKEATTIGLNDPWTPLELACERNQIKAARVLLEAGANAHDLLLGMVCELGFLDLAKLLVQLSTTARNSLQRDMDDSPLHSAARTAGNRKVVEWLIDQGALVEASSFGEPGEHSNVGWTPLMDACSSGIADTAEILINRGANVHTRTEDGLTPLYVSCTDGGSTEIAKMLLDRGADLEHGEYPNTPLLGACGEGNSEAAKLLVERGANIEATNDHKQTPLHSAAKNGHADIVSLLLDHGADTTAIDANGNLPVHYACQLQNLEIARLFFKHESTTTSADGVTLLHVACRFGCMMPTLQILQAGSSKIDEQTGDSKTALHLACEFGHKPIVQVLLNKDARLEIVDKDGWTALHWACGKGYTEIAEMLLYRGCDGEATERHGWSPLQVACQNTKLETVQKLLELDANIHACATNGSWTCLHIVCKFGGSKVARLLLDKGADLNARTAKDWTPLHVACRYGHLKIVRLLLDRGADWSMRAKGKSTPEKLARKHNHTRIAQLLASRKKASK